MLWVLLVKIWRDNKLSWLKHIEMICIHKLETCGKHSLVLVKKTRLLNKSCLSSKNYLTSEESKLTKAWLQIWFSEEFPSNVSTRAEALSNVCALPFSRYMTWRSKFKTWWASSRSLSWRKYACLLTLCWRLCWAPNIQSTWNWGPTWSRSRRKSKRRWETKGLCIK